MVEAPLARESVGPKNPTDRGKNGSKRHVVVEGRGVPLPLVVRAANTHDSRMIGALLDARVAHPADEATMENLCLDAGYPAHSSARRGSLRIGTQPDFLPSMGRRMFSFLDEPFPETDPAIRKNRPLLPRIVPSRRRHDSPLNRDKRHLSKEACNVRYKASFSLTARNRRHRLKKARCLANHVSDSFPARLARGS